MNCGLLRAAKPPRSERHALKAAEYCENRPPPGLPAPGVEVPVTAPELPEAPAVPLGRRPRRAPPKADAALAGTPWLSRHAVNFALLADVAPAADDADAAVEADVAGVADLVDPPPQAAATKPDVAMATVNKTGCRRRLRRPTSAGLRAGFESIGLNSPSNSLKADQELR